MVLLPSRLFLKKEIWEICFLEAALWRHQTHQVTAPQPPVVSAELNISYLETCKKNHPSTQKNHKRKTWLAIPGSETMTSEAWPGFWGDEASRSRFYRSRATYSKEHHKLTSFLAGQKALLILSYAPEQVQGLFHIIIQTFTSLVIQSFDTSMPEPLRRLQTQAKAIGLFRESNHCEYLIKSNSFCSRNVET